MIQCRPVVRNKKAATISFFLIIISVTIFLLGGKVGKYLAVMQIIALICAAVGIFIIIKYIATDYLYTLKNGHLLINKINGRKSVCEVELSFDMFRSPPLTEKEYAEKYRDIGSVKRYSYCKNIDSEETRYILADICGINYLIIFEPDKPFLEALNNMLSEYGQNAENTDDDQAEQL